MAYAASNPPGLLMQAAAGPRVWFYQDGDGLGTVDGADYFANGDALGMKVGDLIFGTDIDASPVDGYVLVVTAVTAGGAATASEYQALTTT